MKYCIIIVHEKVRSMGKRKVEYLFLVLDVFYPTMIFFLFHLLKNDNTFVGDPYQEEFFLQNSITVTNKTIVKLFGVCVYEAYDEISIPYIVSVLQTTFCWILSISIFLNSINILEVFIYYKIFRFMNR